MARLPVVLDVKVKRLYPDAKLPTYATDGSGCFDLYAHSVQGFDHVGTIIDHGSPVECGTGLAFEIPPGHVMLVFSRSGMGIKHGIRLANAVGVIDADYRGEVVVKLVQDYRLPVGGQGHYEIRPGDRIAQAMVIPLPRVQFFEVGELSQTARGSGGFGSTGY